MLIKRDSELDTQDNFKFHVRSKLEHNHSVDQVTIDGSVFGWIVKEHDPVKVLTVSQGIDDPTDMIKGLHGLTGSSLDLFTYKLGEEPLTIADVVAANKIQVLFLPDTTHFQTTDEIMSLYLSIKPLGIKMLYSHQGSLYELAGLNIQASKVQ